MGDGDAGVSFRHSIEDLLELSPETSSDSQGVFLHDISELYLSDRILHLYGPSVSSSRVPRERGNDAKGPDTARGCNRAASTGGAAGILLLLFWYCFNNFSDMWIPPGYFIELISLRHNSETDTHFYEYLGGFSF